MIGPTRQRGFVSKIITLSRMKVAALLTERVDVERLSTEQDAFGAPSNVWEVVMQDVPCRFILSLPTEATQQNKLLQAGNQDVIRQRFRVVFMHNMEFDLGWRLRWHNRLWKITHVYPYMTDQVSQDIVVSELWEEDA
jgi:hypothetical protein